MAKLNLPITQTESSSIVLRCAILCHTFQDGREKLHLCVCYTNITPSTLHHFDPSEPSGNQQDLLDAKKMMSGGCFIHQLVTEVEPAWSNGIRIACCPYPTIVRCNSKYFALRRIILLSTWYQNLSVSLERLWGFAVMLAFELEHTVKQEGPVSIAETVLFFFHIHVCDFCKARNKKLRFQFWYNEQNIFNTNGIYLILTKNIPMFWVLYCYFYVKQNYS